MDERKIIPLWTKTGVIPSPKMPASRVNSGQLLSMLAGVAASYKGPSGTFKTACAEVVEKTIVSASSPSCTFYEENEHLCIEILADEDKNVFGYSLFLPLSWFGKLRKN